MRRTPAPGTDRATGPAAVLALQALAGNAAVAVLLSRQPVAGSRPPNAAAAVTVAQRLAGECPPAPPPPVGITPATDPRFAAARRHIAATAHTARHHPAAASEVSAAQGAAPAPLDDKQAQAEAAQTATMAAARPGGFDKAAFIAAVRAAVTRHAPPNLEEADRFAGSARSGQIRSDVQGLVGRSKSEAARDIADRTAQPPDPGVAVDKAVTPLAPVPPTPGLAPPNAGLVTPAPAPAEQTDLRAGPCQTDAMMASAGVTDEQLAESNEPEFTEALAAKQAGEQHSATAPAEVRAVEARELAATTEAARAAGGSEVSAMAGVHETNRSAVDTARAGTVSADHEARAALNAELRPIFTATKQDVERILSELDDKIGRRFDDGERQARAAFTADHQARLARYKADRYSGPGGWARWLADLPGLPAEVNQIYHHSKQVYEQRMQTVVADLADLVGGELGRAKARIAEGRRRVDQLVAGKPAALQRVARDAAAEFNREFDTLERAVDEKQRSLVDDLASRYVAARGAIDAEIEQLQQENEGLWGKAKEAVAGTVRTVMQLKDMLTGVLARAAGAVELIIKAPVRFLGNLVNAVKGGVVAFGNNIWTHLKAGLKTWLLGSLADAGLEIPERFDLMGILRLVLSVLGLTWVKIRQRIVQVIPERVMQRLEQTVEIVQILVTDGLPGLWRWVLQKVGDLKEMVLGQIKSFVVEKVIKAGIVWLVSMLNPASAFVKACKAIYDIVMFFVQRGSQIKSFVDSVLDSIGAIARGGGGAVVGIVENALARALPVVIGFLASLLNLGGIPDKLRSVIDTVRAPVADAVEWVTGMVVKAGKSLMSHLRGSGQDGEPGEERAADGDVRERARQTLASRTNRPFARRSDLEAVAHGVLAELRPQGLKELRLHEKEDGSGRFELLAVASPETNVGEAEVEEPAYYGDPSELDAESVWDSYEDRYLEVLAGMRYRMSEHAVEENLKNLKILAKGQPEGKKALAAATAKLMRVAQTTYKNDNGMFEAAKRAFKPVSRLYEPPLEVHHVGLEVAEAPATHFRTKVGREKDKIRGKIRDASGDPAKLSDPALREIFKIKEQGGRDKEVNEIIRLYSEQVVEGLVDNPRPGASTEVVRALNLILLTKKVHTQTHAEE